MGDTTPIRTCRIPDELWERVKHKAKSNGDEVSTVIRRLLFAYVSKP